MDVKNRKVEKRFGFSHIPITHPNFVEQLEDGIIDSVLHLIGLGYVTTSSCEGHKTTPFITLDKKTTNTNITKYFNNFFVACEVEKDFIIIKGNRNLFLSNSFLCKKIYNAVIKLPINT